MALASFLRDETTAVAQAAVREVARQVGDLEPLTSITNFVHRVPLASGSVIVKANVTGRSKPSSLRWLSSLPPADQRVALARSAVRTSTGFRREARGLRLLRDVIGSDHTPRVLAARSSSLITADVGSHSKFPSGDPAALRVVHPLMSEIWSLPIQSLSVQQRADLEMVRSRGIVATFIGKFAAPSPTTPIADLIGVAGLKGELPAAHHLEDVVRRAMLPADRVIYGDLKPEHILTNGDGVLHLIDPALQFGSPAEDVARLISRWLMDGATFSLEVLGQAAELADVARLSNRERSALGALIVMDACNIWSTRAMGELLCMPQEAGWPPVDGARHRFESLWTELPRLTTLPLAGVAGEVSAITRLR